MISDYLKIISLLDLKSILNTRSVLNITPTSNLTLLIVYQLNSNLISFRAKKA